MLDETIRLVKVNGETKVEISVANYKYLQKASARLEGLEADGVDNWSGYQEENYQENMEAIEQYLKDFAKQVQEFENAQQ